MNLRHAVLAIAVLTSASTTSAQSLLANAILELRIVPVNGQFSPGLWYPYRETHESVPPNSIDRTRRFEVQYRIIDSDNVGAAGLTSMQMSVRIVPSGSVPWTIRRSLLSRFQVQLAAMQAVPNPDTSGPPTGLSIGATGMHRPYRGGFCTPPPCSSQPANGVITNTGITGITPLTLSQSNQAGDEYFGLFSFEVTVGPAPAAGDEPVRFDVIATAVTDPNNGNRWGGFVNGDPVPHVSTHAVDGHTAFLVLPAGSCRADMDDSGNVTVGDLFAYLGAYFAHGATADLDDSGAITIEDLFDFLNAYFTGCA